MEVQKDIFSGTLTIYCEIFSGFSKCGFLWTWRKGNSVVHELVKLSDKENLSFNFFSFVSPIFGKFPSDSCKVADFGAQLLALGPAHLHQQAHGRRHGDNSSRVYNDDTVEARLRADNTRRQQQSDVVAT
ncbi:hypothetical protein SESBI_16277 [Sesbania bispinosa]|nr:hypothetical protein SESBI_16277 [Sesbania bispinosa]